MRIREISLNLMPTTEPDGDPDAMSERGVTIDKGLVNLLASEKRLMIALGHGSPGPQEKEAMRDIYQRQEVKSVCVWVDVSGAEDLIQTLLEVSIGYLPFVLIVESMTVLHAQSLYAK